MPMGRRSLLFGAHQFLIHPIFLAAAWVKLYGFNTVKDPYVGEVSLANPLLWLSFIVHDWGYFFCTQMDDEIGEQHPNTGAIILYQLTGSWEWYDFVLFHSRFLAKRANKPYSLLCVADKLSVALEPSWLYLPRVKATGEIKEYMALAVDSQGKYKGEIPYPNSEREWFDNMTKYLVNWAMTHRNGCEDTWTAV